MMEWRDGQLMDDEELERLWQMSEMQKPPLTAYDKLIFWFLAGLFCISVWAFAVWLVVRFL